MSKYECWICKRTEKEIQTELRRLCQFYSKVKLPEYNPDSGKENRLFLSEPPEKLRVQLLKFRLWNDKYEEGEYKIGVQVCDICSSILANVSILMCDKFMIDNAEIIGDTRRVHGIRFGYIKKWFDTIWRGCGWKEQN